MPIMSTLTHLSSKLTSQQIKQKGTVLRVMWIALSGCILMHHRWITLSLETTHEPQSRFMQTSAPPEAASFVQPSTVPCFLFLSSSPGFLNMPPHTLLQGSLRAIVRGRVLYDENKFMWGFLWIL